ncbi:MAG: hypothetical protein LUE64_07320 [Candidatus Gastranaerophilales bacterium]|nr:hypothetical protein [Candidatus Gastranaerophilales bacterium]
MKFSEIQNKLAKILGRKVTQSEIAKALDLDRTSINKRIKAAGELNVNYKARIEQYFGIDLDTEENHNMCDELLNVPIVENLTLFLKSTTQDIFNNQSLDKFVLPTSLMKRIGASLDSSLIFSAEDESMRPTIISGQDLVMVDTSKKEIYDGKMYFFKMNKTLFVKRLQKLPNNKLKVISDNPEYESYFVDLDDKNIGFEVIGRVMWISRLA